LIKIWVKYNFFIIFNKFYKTTNLLQREATRDVEPSIHNNGERLTHQVTKLNRDNRRACARQMNPNKTSEHKDANQWEEKARPSEMQIKTNEKKKWHHTKWTPNGKPWMQWRKWSEWSQWRHVKQLGAQKWQSERKKLVEPSKVKTKEAKHKIKTVVEMLK